MGGYESLQGRELIVEETLGANTESGIRGPKFREVSKKKEEKGKEKEEEEEVEEKVEGGEGRGGGEGIEVHVVDKKVTRTTTYSTAGAHSTMHHYHPIMRPVELTSLQYRCVDCSKRGVGQCENKRKEEEEKEKKGEEERTVTCTYSHLPRSILLCTSWSPLAFGRGARKEIVRRNKYRFPVGSVMVGPEMVGMVGMINGFDVPFVITVFL